MSHAKTERLVNLTLALMATSRLLTVTEIGRLVGGYGPDGSETGGDAFRRMFERDKEELRELGIPLQTGTVDPLYGDDIGYRVVRSDYALPDIALDPDEAAALGLAARLWSSAQLSEAANGALRKLAAAGVEPLAPPAGLEARVDANEPAFGPLFDAVISRRAVRFGYRRPGAQSSERHLQPWGLVSWHGRWYIGGHDLDRADTRVFRLSRVEGAVTLVGPAGAYTVPPGVDVRELVNANSPDPQQPQGFARVRLAPGTGQRLRRNAAEIDGDPNLLDVPYVSLHGIADLIAGYGPDAVAVAPPQLRSMVAERLRAVLS